KAAADRPMRWSEERVMRQDKKSIEEILERGLPAATRQQMDAAGNRVSARLRAERQRLFAGAARGEEAEGSTPVQQSARANGWWRMVIATGAAAALIAVVVLVGIPPRDQSLYAVLEAADSSMYRIRDGNSVPIRVGDRIAAQETLRSIGGAGG